jgi:aldehyde dehydrogenase (NAD+)
MVTGGKRLDREGYFVEPTLFTEVDPNMRIAQEEIFGPVLSVIKFKDLEEAISIANNSEYGLVGGVFSKDQITCYQVTERVEVGHMSVNSYFANCYDNSFGGVKNSGISRELGPGALETYLEEKTIIYDFNP